MKHRAKRMKRCSCILLAWLFPPSMKSLALILLAGLTGPVLAAPPKPNVVIIFMDDMGYGDIGPFGATMQKTPALDRMAAEGMKFTSFYAAPVCSVSRAQLLTGCYGPRIDVPGVYGPGSANGLNPREHTIAERLRDLGYATLCIGKWHVGDQPEFLPTKQGFDGYFGIPYSNDMQRKSSVTGERVTPLLRGDKVAELLTDPQQEHLVERYTDEAVRFITANKDRPFFLYLPHTAIHTPIYPGEKFRGKSSNGRVGDWIEEVDWSTGRVLDTLRELAPNTLVIFTSDNGPWLVKEADSGSAGPLRGGKGSTWEGGMRVPTIAWWPGKIAPASTVDAIAGTIDLLPTAVTIAGGTVPEEPVIDGRDLSPLLLGRTKDSPRGVHYYFSGYQLQAVREGPWKLALVPQNETMGRPVQPDARTSKPRLYNLDTEIGEQTNLADQQPEIVAKLTALAERMSAGIGGKNPTARRPAGKVRNPQLLYPDSPQQQHHTPAADLRGQWEFVPDPKLPNVLLLGDSISIAYTLDVRHALRGKANVFRPMLPDMKPDNCGDTPRGLALLEQWLGDNRWDVIHFNWGLWDLCYRHPQSKEQGGRDKVRGKLTTTPKDYERNLEKLVTRLKATGAKLIWANTTVVPEGEAGRFVGDDAKYNAIAARVMERHHIPVNDLHRTSKSFPPALFSGPGDVHFTPEGSAKLARQVAERISNALEAP
jgi:arylsulfatase A